MQKEIIGSLYTDVSDDFQRGIYPIARCIKAEKHDLGVVEMEIKQIGNIMPTRTRENPNQGRVYDSDAIAPSITNVSGGGGREPMIVAMRGRNPDNPSDRTAGSPTEQRLEPNSQDICNTLTSVQKDNLVMEKQVVVCNPYNVDIEQTNTYRIRKLTPLECWRLMGFSDEDFHKAEAVNSNSQLYKQAGNSIVEPVLMAILGQMIPAVGRKTEHSI